MYKRLRLSLLGLGLLAAVFTQCQALTAVPGLHFDEAWQGLFAGRIAFEHGFWPLQAMNAYTAAVVHYPLALAFKIFGPSLAVMRGFYAVMNLSALALFVLMLLQAGLLESAAVFAWLWALLPFFVHTHRFYIEMTGFFSLCMAACLFAVQNWRRRLSPFLFLIAAGLGTLSHILFIALPMALLFAAARESAPALKWKKTKAVVAAYGALVLFLCTRVYLFSGKKTPLFMAVFILFAIWAVIQERISAFSKRLPAWALALIAAPFVAIFLFIAWNGPWNYAQATGTLHAWWLPVNAGFFLYFCFKKTKEPRSAGLWAAFLASLLVCSAIVYKPTPRYFTIPAIFGALWICVRARNVFKYKKALLLFAALALFNAYGFRKDYISQFERQPGTDSEFRVWIFHDSARDFRPFQKLSQWAVERGCATLYSEDDRFGLPLQFMRRSQANPHERSACRWKQNQLFFSHIPSPDPNLKLLAHQKDWGDLAVWMRAR